MAKVMISLPDDLLARIDQEAKRRGRSRSGFLQDAAHHALGRPDVRAFDAALARSRARFAGAGKFDSGSLIRKERNARDRRDRRPL
ncbi:MAG: ribbon-helix-helix protein, CopG family [Verrucomicrobia bacterium]|nr:ribbon-helix-helix protein, CopG family [Verrucomicrobiota bacterium]